MKLKKLLFSIITLLICIQTNTYAQELFIFDESANCTFDSHRIHKLIKNDSLYKATSLLNDALEFTRNNGFVKFEAKTYNHLGMVFSEMGHNQSAENYYSKALKIYDSINDSRGRDHVLCNLNYSHLLNRDDTKFDSTYSQAIESSKALNSELYFLNLEHKIKYHYFSNNDLDLLALTNFALEELSSTDFSKLNFSRDFIIEDLKSKQEQIYNYYKAIALIRLEKFDEGYKLLFSIDDQKFEKAIELDKYTYRQLCTLNYYKYRYFNEIDKQPDSAIAYLLKSDTYKYQALRNYERNNGQNGDLIYKIIQTQEKLKSTNELMEKDEKISNSFLVSTIISSVLLFMVIVFCIYYYRTRVDIQTINDDLKESNKKLLKQDKERLEFFSVLSHELRTPIYGINGLATLIEQEKNEEKKASYLSSLIASSNYISILIDNVLQATRLKFERKVLRLKPTKIEYIVKDVLSTVKIAAENKGLKLISNIEESDINEYVMVDKVAFSQILINLAFNAIRYTKEGYVSINVKTKKRRENDIDLFFEVKDTGIGIKNEHRETVFNAFENRLFLQKNSSGSGLGLYIVKTLLKSHDSDIDFVSEPNVGSNFYFTVRFDLCENPANKIKAPNKAKIIEHHVLIVDDNKINLLITKKNVEKIPGYTCETASNGRQALSMVKEKDYDLVLMDINMPDMDGFEVTRHIRMFNKDVPIIALTALNSSEIEKKASHVGINQIITKPYIFENFQGIIRQYSRVLVPAEEIEVTS
ncbi:MAG: response regulator [Bacteroidota bacterium]